jgi:hypothetical protein
MLSATPDSITPGTSLSPESVSTCRHPPEIARTVSLVAQSTVYFTSAERIH